MEVSINGVENSWMVYKWQWKHVSFLSGWLGGLTQESSIWICWTQLSSLKSMKSSPVGDRNLRRRNLRKLSFFSTEACSTFKPWEWWFIIGKSSPFMAQRFRLVNYHHLHRSFNSWNVEGDVPIARLDYQSDCCTTEGIWMYLGLSEDVVPPIWKNYHHFPSWLVVWNMFYFSIYSSQLNNIFQMG